MNKRKHERLKRTLPFDTMRFYVASILFKGHQMRYFMYGGDQETIAVQTPINGYLMKTIGKFSIITVLCDPFVYDFKVNRIFLD